MSNIYGAQSHRLVSIIGTPVKGPMMKIRDCSAKENAKPGSTLLNGKEEKENVNANESESENVNVNEKGKERRESNAALSVTVVSTNKE